MLPYQTIYYYKTGAFNYYQHYIHNTWNMCYVPWLLVSPYQEHVAQYGVLDWRPYPMLIQTLRYSSGFSKD